MFVDKIMSIFLTLLVAVVVLTALWDIFYNNEQIINWIIKSLTTILSVAVVILILFGVYELKKCRFGSKFEIDVICNNTWKFIFIWLWYILGFAGIISFIGYYSYNIKKK